MSRGIYNVNRISVIIQRCIFRQNRNSALPFQIVGIHDALLHGLIFPKGAALLEQSVYKRRFPMIHMRYNGDISYVFPYVFRICFHIPSISSESFRFL